jgi:hypothetical protein
MQKSAIERDLRALGIDSTDHRVLKLLPLVYVAWADGKMESVERERILNLAAETFPIGDRAIGLLRTWLSRPLSREYIQHGLRDLLLLAHAPDDLDVSLDELPMLLSYAEGIARSTASALDAPSAVTQAEEDALSDIAGMLQIDNGTSWAELLRELEIAIPPRDYVAERLAETTPAGS